MKSFSTKFKLSVIFSTVVIAVIIASLYIINTDKPAVEEMPPRLSYDADFFKGLIKIEDERYFKFSETEILNALNTRKYDDSILRLGRQIQYFYSDEDLTIKEILASIVPQEKNKFAIAYYDAEIGNWYTYPKGPFLNTVEITERNIENNTIPAGHAFVIAGERNFETINLKHGSEIPSDLHFEISDLYNGWTLLAVPNNDEFESLINRCRNKVKTIWVQKANNDFEKTELYYPRLKPGYHLAWFLIGDLRNDCIDYTVTVGGDGDDDEAIVETGSDEDPVVVLCNDTPVCDNEGVWYENNCIADENSAEIDDSYLASEGGECINFENIDTGAMPTICNPLVESPVCDADGNWYKNKCYAYMENEDFVPTRVYAPLPGEEICKLRSEFESDLDLHFVRPDITTSEEDEEVSVADGIAVAPRDNDLLSRPSSESIIDLNNEAQDLPLNDEEVITGDEISLTPDAPCISTTPVCTENGLYYNNICELKNDGYVEDSSSKYLTTDPFISSKDGVKYCRGVDLPVDNLHKQVSSTFLVDLPVKVSPLTKFTCIETTCIYDSYLSYSDTFDLNSSITQCEMGSKNCFEILGDSLDGKEFNSEYFNLLDSLLLKTDICCTTVDDLR